MPVTLSIVNHAATAWKGSRVEKCEDFMKRASPSDYRRCQRIIQTSLNINLLQENHISPSENGLVWSACHAYNQHHHLTIRPEDVWFAILTQISFFINANAEDLRSFFVEHDGQKELEVIKYGTLETVDFGEFAQQMAGLITKNVKDPELGDWVMPNFSTTTDTDRVVASVLFMGAMQKYFSYTFGVCCGLPSVTLLGEISDWQAILNKLPMLERLGDEPTQFVEMLSPILNNMIRSFEQPEDEEVVRFWNTIATHNPVGSGTNYYTGWITAFCFWDDQGKAKHRSSRYNLGDVLYPTVAVDSVPVGFARVPVKIDNYGTIISSNMVAGSLGIQAMTINQQRLRADLSSPESRSAIQTNNVVSPREVESEVLSSDSELTVIQPLSGWLIYECEDEQKPKARKERFEALARQGGPATSRQLFTSKRKGDGTAAPRLSRRKVDEDKVAADEGTVS